MPSSNSTSAFKEAFIRRTAEARMDAGLTQLEIANALQIDQGSYKMYETRSILPHKFVPTFCAVTRVSIEWLYGLEYGQKKGQAATHQHKRRA